MRAAGFLAGTVIIALGLSTAHAQTNDQRTSSQHAVADCSDVPSTLEVHTIPKPPGEPENMSVSTFTITGGGSSGQAPDLAKVEAQLKRETDRVVACLKAREHQ